MSNYRDFVSDFPNRCGEALTTFIDTNWSDPDGDGIDNYPDSMLDFAFVAGPAKDWNPVCKVIIREGDFPDDGTTSNHRPIELRLTTIHSAVE